MALLTTPSVVIHSFSYGELPAPPEQSTSSSSSSSSSSTTPTLDMEKVGKNIQKKAKKFFKEDSQMRDSFVQRMTEQVLVLIGDGKVHSPISLTKSSQITLEQDEGYLYVQRIEMIAKGSFGKVERVFTCSIKKNGKVKIEESAMKRAHDPEDPSLANEAASLRSLHKGKKHVKGIQPPPKHQVSLLKSDGSEGLALINEEFEGNLKEQSEVCWKSCGNLIRGLAKIHAEGMVQGDIKNTNVLTKGKTYVISDFGGSLPLETLYNAVTKKLEIDQEETVPPNDTLLWAPSSIIGTVFTQHYVIWSDLIALTNALQKKNKELYCSLQKARDVWALGKTLFESITGSELTVTAKISRGGCSFPNPTTEDQAKWASELTDLVPPKIAKLILKMLELDPNKRATIAEICKKWG